MDAGGTNQQQPDAQAELSEQAVQSSSRFADDRVYLNMPVHAKTWAGRLGDSTDPEADSKLCSVEDYSRRQYSALPQTNNRAAPTAVGNPRSGTERSLMDIGNGSTKLTFTQMIDRQSILSLLLNDHVLVLEHVPHRVEPHVCGLFGCPSVKPELYRLSLNAAEGRGGEVRMVYDKTLFCRKCIEMLFGETKLESTPGIESEE